jgi:hypothetical protein
MRSITRVIGQVAALVALVLVSAGQSYGQDKYVELLRSDIKATKVAFITEALQMSAEDADKFWPIHRDYDAELDKINDGRIALIREYLESYDTEMTLKKTKELMERSIKLEEERLKLRTTYFKKFDKEVNSNVAAKWLWSERLLQALGTTQLSMDLPFLK